MYTVHGLACIQVHVNTRICKYRYIYTHLHVYICICIYIHSFMYICVYTHTCIFSTKESNLESQTRHTFE